MLRCKPGSYIGGETEAVSSVAVRARKAALAPQVQELPARIGQGGTQMLVRDRFRRWQRYR
jgi:hypothetical protein